MSDLLKELSMSGDLLEGRVDINTLMTLDKFIATGKVENRLLYSIMTAMIQMLKYGNLNAGMKDYNSVMMPVETINMLRAMPPEQLVPMAVQFRDILHSQNSGFGVYCNPDQDMHLWLQQFYTAKKAQD